ncbi:DUF445 domain-containing protein [Stenoxybacter acetivorans]|uniref:DUF445 domain-containing protein n=1 Tax=Stenoxybacter acetivorans TaxID=422441 RepID=UPI0005648D04|nr:DUF445 domain-containing protein [Stenoxybacter acetivorans]
MTNTLSEFHRRQQAQQALRRARISAGILLLLMLVLFFISAYYLPRYPLLGYLKAFSEAALVGGLADWFAVTALFRRPFRLPIPHTAILPRKQKQIAESFGHFIEHNFLQSKSIAVRVYQLQVLPRLLAWLAQPKNRSEFMPQLAAQIPVLIHSIPPEKIAALISKWAAQNGNGQTLGVLLADILTLSHQQEINHSLLRRLIPEIRNRLKQESTQQLLEQSLLAWAGKIETEAPSSWEKLKTQLKIGLAEKMDDWAAKKIIGWADAYLEDALKQPQHSLWQHYEKLFHYTTENLKHNSDWQQQLAAHKYQWAQSEGLQNILIRFWQNGYQWSLHDVQQSDSLIQQQLNRLLDYALNQAHQNPRFLKRSNARLAWWVKQLVEQHKHQATVFITEKINAWNSQEITEKLELNIGKDLQYIRINGTLVGGLAGLLIYLLSTWLLH